MFDGLKRIINSAKVQLLASAALGAVVTYLFTPGTSAEKRGLLQTMVVALASLIGAVILGWAHEDAAEKRGTPQTPQPQPQPQINVGSDVVNTQAQAPAPTPTPKDTMKKSQILSLLLVSFLFIGGCACPEKAVLREALSQAVAPAMAENIDLVDKIANGKPLPHFIPGDVQIRKDNQSKVNELISTDRANDANKGFFGIGK